MRRFGFLFFMFLQCLASNVFADPSAKKTDGPVERQAVKFIVSVESGLKFDSLTIMFWPQPLSGSFSTNVGLPHATFVSRVDKKGQIIFDIPNKERFGYITLVSGFERNNSPFEMLGLYLVEAGDSVVLKISDNPSKVVDDDPIQWNDSYFMSAYRYKDLLFSFSGKGSAKYRCRHKADLLASGDRANGQLMTNEGEYVAPNHFDEGLRKSLEVLTSYKKSLDTLVYEVLKADFIGKYRYDKLVEINMTNTYLVKRANNADLSKKFNALLVRNINENEKDNLPEEAKLLSKNYGQYLVANESVGRGIKDGELYREIKGNYAGELRQKMVAILMAKLFSTSDSVGYFINDALIYTDSHYYREILQKYREGMINGNVAYNFVLSDTGRLKVSLDKYRGKVVFIDFWYTGCGACKDYYKYVLAGMEDKYSKNDDVVFVSVSIDKSYDVWRSSLDAGKYSSYEVVNLFTEGNGQNHDVIRKYNVRGYPRPVLIGKDGKIYESNQHKLRDAVWLDRLISSALTK